MHLLAYILKSVDIPGEHEKCMQAVHRIRGGGTQRANDMQRQNDRELREQLMKLKAEHRELDEEIVAIEESGLADQLNIRRLKKKKLALKDQITSIEDQLLPDIIA